MNRDTKTVIDADGNMTLDQLVRDPLIQQLMTSDGVERGSIEALFVWLAHERVAHHYGIASGRRNPTAFSLVDRPQGLQRPTRGA